MPRIDDPKTIARTRRKKREPVPVQHGRGHAGEGGKVLRPQTQKPVAPAIKQALAVERSYGSQGRMVQRTADQQRAVARVKRGGSAPPRNRLTPLQQAEIRDARVAYLRRSRLTGVKLLEHFGETFGRNSYVPNTGGGPNLGARGTQTFRAPRGTAALLAPTQMRYGDSPEGRAIARDIATLGTGPFIGGIAIGGAGVGLLHGDTNPSEKLLKGAAAGLAETAKHPLRSLKQHPLIVPLTAAGAFSVAGRTAGATLRGAGKAGARGPRGAAHRAGSTVRPPLALVNDAAAVRHGSNLHERRYSKDSTRKAAQVLADKRRQPLRDAQGNVVMIKHRGRTVPVLRASHAEREGGLVRNRAGLLGQAANFETARTNAAERAGREVRGRESTVQGPVRATTARAVDRIVRRELSEKGIRGRKARDVTMLVAGGTIRSEKTFHADLAQWRDRIAATLRAHDENPENTPYLDAGEVAQARANVKLGDALIRRTANDPELVRRIVSVGETMGRRLNTREEEGITRGVYTDATRVRRARVIHTAVEHQGARHVTAEEHAKLEERAGAIEATALRKLEEAQKGKNGRVTPEVVAAKHEWQNARRNRIAVSGRDPEGVRSHEAGKAVLSRAKYVEKAARRRLRVVQDKHKRLMGAQASRRGRRQAEARKGELKSRTGPRPEGRATPGEVTKVSKSFRDIVKAKAELKAAVTERRKAAEAADAAKLPDQTDALRRGDGTFLSTDEIHRRLREDTGRDPESVAYLPNSEPGRRAFHARFDLNRPVIDKPGVRTGSQYLKGATDTSAELLRAQGVKQGVQIDKAHAIDRLVEGGLRRPDGEAFTAKESAEFTKRLELDTDSGLPIIRAKDGERFVPMREHAAKLSDETIKAIEDGRQGADAMDSLHLHLLNDRIAVGPGAKNVVLVPARKIEQQMEHLRPAGKVEKATQFLNRPFRMAVLPQPRWLTGNFVEPYVVRLTVKGSGLNVFGLGLDIRAAGKVLRTMERHPDPAVRDAAAEIRAQHFGGLFVGNRGASVHRGLEDFPKLERAYGRMVAALPITRQAAEAATFAVRFALAPLRAFFHVNRVIESGAQRAAFGKSFRQDLQEFTGSYVQTLRLQQKALDEAVKGLVNTPTQQRLMREQHEILGKYEGYGPTLRAWIQGPMPFLPWALNAARFAYWTMPANHTALTAFLLQVNDVVRQSWDDQHRDAPPGGLKFALPTEKGGWIDVARYTPYGLITPASGGEYAGLTNQLIPQVQGSSLALGFGLDPFGKKFKVPPGQSANNAMIALNSALEALVPYVSQVRRLREGGGTSYGNSTVLHPKVKPGTTHMSGARRVFDPFRPTYLGQPISQKPQKQIVQPPQSSDPIDHALHALDLQAQQGDAQDAAIDEALRRLSR